MLQNTKRALVELISHLDMDLHVPLDRDEVFRQSLSDHDDSSVEGGPAAAMQQGRPGSAGSSTGLSFGYGMNIYVYIILSWNVYNMLW